MILLWGKSANQVIAGIDQVKVLTDRNFAINLNLSFPYRDQLQACIDKKVHAVSLFWGMEPSAIVTAKDGGLVVLVASGARRKPKFLMTQEQMSSSRRAGKRAATFGVKS